MIRTALRYHQPTSLADAAQLLADDPEQTAVLAGGTQLLPLMHRGERNYEHVVDLKRLALNWIVIDEQRVLIGAMVTYADLLADQKLAQAMPILRRVALGITGGRQLTHQATLAGALCHNAPGSDAPGMLAGVDASVCIQGPAGERHAKVTELLVDAGRVALQAGELVSAITIPRHQRGGYCKVKHSSGSWPIATATAVLNANDDLSVTLGAVHRTPIRLEIPSIAAKERHTVLGDLVAEALTEPWSDVLAPGSYRAAIAPVVARRAIDELKRRAA